jgi:hypothetical protein
MQERPGSSTRQSEPGIGRSVGRVGSAFAALLLAAALVGVIAVGNRVGRTPSPQGSPSAAADLRLGTVSPESPAATQIPSAIPNAGAADRPGVPAELRGRTWLAETIDAAPGSDGRSVAVAGIEGTTARSILPAGELGLAADQGLAVSAVIGDGASLLLIREVDSGRLLTSLRTPVVASRGLLVGRRLFWAGAGGPSHNVDAGVWTADLATPSPEPRPVTDPIADLSRFGANVERGPLLASPTGRTVLATIGGLRGTRLEIVDVATLSVRSVLDNLVPIALTDDRALTVAGRTVALHELATGRRLWSLRADLVYSAVADPGSRAFVLGIDLDGRYLIEEVSASNGATRRILGQDHRGASRVSYLSPELSSFDHLVLLPEPALGEALGVAVGSATASVLERSTGRLQTKAFKVGGS